MKRNVLLLAICQALMMSANSLLITATALVGLRIAPQPQWATVPFAFMFVGIIITTYPASIMMQRVGRKAGFTLGALFGICGGGLSAWAIMHESFVTFCMGSVLLGAFNAFGQYYRFAAAETADTHFKSRAISYVLAGGVIAAFVGPNLAKTTREILSMEFAGSYVCIAAIYCCSLLLVQALNLGRPKHTAVGDKITLIDVIRKPGFAIAVISGMVGYGVMNLLMTATPMAMIGFGFHFDLTANVIQWHVVGMFAPAFFTGHLIDKIGAYRVMIAGTFGLLASCALNLSGTEYWQFTVSLLLLGVGWNFCFIGATSLLADDTTAKGKVQGLNDLLIFFTVGVTAFISGQLYNRLGWAAINLYVLPVILFVTLTLFVAILRQRRGARAA